MGINFAGKEDILARKIALLQKYKKYYIFGANKETRQLVEAIKKNGQNNCIMGIVDDDKEKQGKEFCSYIVQGLDVLKKIDKETVLVVNNKNNSFEALALMDQNIIPEEQIDVIIPFINVCAYECLRVKAYKREEELQLKYDKVYSRLKDEKSKNVYRNVVQGRATADSTCYEGLIDEKNSIQYYPKDIFEVTSEDIICDCGAFIGDTLECLMHEIGGEFKSYYAFEANLDNYETLTGLLSEKSYKSVTPINKAVWHKKDVLYFETPIKDNSAFKASEINSVLGTDKDKIKVECNRIDELLGDNEITFIKMDIEGAELNALKGASKIIERDKPLLAICIYHSLEELFTIPDYIMENYGEYYDFYVRHYPTGEYERTLFYAETVFYAVPKNRCLI